MLRRTSAVTALALAGLAGVLVANAWRLEAPPAPGPPGPGPALDVDAAVERFAAALRFPTVSFDDPRQRRDEPLAALRGHLEASFPRVHRSLGRERVGEHSLLYTWPGRRRELRPVVLMAHLDVVPVEDPAAWTHPPFSGAVVDGHVWGRGAIDDKQGVMGILEACEALLAEGFVPARTVHLVFGHDEEVGGGEGTARVAERLAARGARVEFVLDEGGFYAEGMMPGLPVPAALIGIAEKGYLSLELEVQAEAGHSSRPPERMAIGTLAGALQRLQKQPFPARLDGATEAMLRAFAPHMGFGRRVALANLWLLRPVVTRGLTGEPGSAALVRTSTALTLLSAGHKENVLPRRARAVVNLRIVPGETVAGTIARVRRIVDDPNVTVRPLGGDWRRTVEPSPVSSASSPGWQVVAAAAREAWGERDLVVAPYLLTGATDARHLAPLAEDVYRFTGATLTPRDVSRFHGLDERIAVADYARVIEVYWRVLRGLDRLDAAGGAPPS